MLDNTRIEKLNSKSIDDVVKIYRRMKFNLTETTKHFNEEIQLQKKMCKSVLDYLHARMKKDKHFNGEFEDEDVEYFYSLDSKLVKSSINPDMLEDVITNTLSTAQKDLEPVAVYNAIATSLDEKRAKQQTSLRIVKKRKQAKK